MKARKGSHKMVWFLSGALFFISETFDAQVGLQPKPGVSTSSLTAAQQAQLVKSMNEAKNTLPSMQAALQARFRAFRAQQQLRHVDQQLQVAATMLSRTPSASSKQPLQTVVSALNTVRASLAQGTPYTGLVAALATQSPSLTIARIGLGPGSSTPATTFIPCGGSGSTLGLQNSGGGTGAGTGAGSGAGPGVGLQNPAGGTSGSVGKSPGVSLQNPAGGTSGSAASSAQGMSPQNPSASSSGCSCNSSPSITSLSVSQGAPGDLVMINGSGFGTTPGQVNFVLNPGKTHQAAIIDWTDGQITAQVPDASGIPAYNGAVFVATCAPSNSVSFHFVPELETRVLPMTSANMTSYYGPCPSFAGNHQCGTNQDGSAWERIEAGFLSGTKGDTLFFQGLQLRNGWTVNGDPDFAVSPPSETHSGARIASSYLGPNAPSVDVHWWVDAPNRVTQYTLAIWITGPKGVPYQ